MKRISVLLIALAFASVLSACNNPMGKNGQADTITREKALEIALDEAGVSRSDIRDLDIELDRERGGKVWEIDFEHGNLELSYDVDAETGEVTRIERERD